MKNKIKPADPSTRGSRIDQRAHKRLQNLASIMSNALGGAELTEDTFFRQRINLNRQYLRTLTLTYSVENRLTSLCYDLILSTTAKVEEAESFSFQFTSQKHFMPVERKLSVEGAARSAEILERLNDEAVIQRLCDLDFIDVRVEYCMAEKRYAISSRGLVGSTTWMMIPPVTKTIMPTPNEILKIGEVFELMILCVTKL
ncbi:hypothetical protein SAMN05216343_12722 [Oscillibacter sp. PC13]|uniref:hypothetical protein n=1 Tax=Oscillibacter sp. PC13 TaxID=1855299 RepID=UPI0008E86D93|nr:hypothetical protein [Oscillibacter sp. PC13]SFQ15910.1 hypothetical protein SAMN05216343_12722 [Oscillibacter sp. PC13]